MNLILKFQTRRTKIKTTKKTTHKIFKLNNNIIINRVKYIEVRKYYYIIIYYRSPLPKYIFCNEIFKQLLINYFKCTIIYPKVTRKTLGIGSRPSLTSIRHKIFQL